MISIYGSMSKNLQHPMPSSTSSTLHYSHSREIAQKSNFVHKNNMSSASILHPVPHSTYSSPVNIKKRGRTLSETLSLSPNLNDSIKRQRRKISTKNNIQSILPSLVSLSPKPKKRSKSKSKPKRRVLADNWSETDHSYSGDDDYIPPRNRKKKIDNSNSSDSEISTPSGYRPLNWRKKQVATPKFVKISDYNFEKQSSLHRIKSLPNMLGQANGAKIGMSLQRANSVSIDLLLPTLPKGPWSFKLGREYDSKPLVPSNVMNRPLFNYNIPWKQLQQRQFGINSMENWWKMPSHLIRRTDYGNMGNSKIVSIDDDDKKNNIKDDEAKKRELIQLYKLAKQAQKLKKKDNKKKKKEKKKVLNGPIDVRLLLK